MFLELCEGDIGTAISCIHHNVKWLHLRDIHKGEDAVDVVLQDLSRKGLPFFLCLGEIPGECECFDVFQSRIGTDRDPPFTHKF